MNEKSARGGWRVRIVENGRDGDVIYEEAGRTLSFYWAFGAGDVVTSVAVGDAGEWRANHPWAADRREEIITRIGAELIRQRAPSCRAELDATGRHLNIITDGAPLAPAPAPKQAAAADFVWRLNKAKSQMSMIVLVAVLIGGAVLVAGRELLTIKTIGTPIGASARAGDFIVTPISRLEPYVPSPNRDHARDRNSIGLLIHSARDEGLRRYVPVAEGRSGSDSANIRIDAVAGDLVWFNAPEERIIDVRAARILSDADAERTAPPPRPAGVEALFRLATAERRLESLLAAPGEEGAPAPRADADRFGAAYLRAAPHQGALSLGGDNLLVYWSKRYREGLMTVARVDAAGEIGWRTETDLGRLDEALPDQERPAFIGARPRIEGRVAEPLLVVIDAQTGRAVTHSLLVE